MSDLSVSEWGIGIFFFLLMAAYAFLLGDYCFQAITRIQTRTKRPLLRKWGVENDLFRPASFVWFIIEGGVFSFFTACLIFLNSHASEVLLGEIPLMEDLNTNPRDFTISIAAYTFFLGFVLKQQSTMDIARKVRNLNNLRNVYHQRFTVSELLSMYESLRAAPQLFWEEYASLPDKDVNEKTNFKYRERVAPYQFSQSNRHNRTVITVAVLTFLVTAVLVVIEIFS